MKILDIRQLQIPDVVVINYKRFMDHREYFTEHFRKSDLIDKSGIESLKEQQFFLFFK